jgi:hypothetical protein
MKQFLLFAGDTYYPGGGWDDFVGDFETVEAARNAAASCRDWWQVIDTATMKEVEFLAIDGSIVARS